MIYKLKSDRQKLHRLALEHSVKEKRESSNMFKGTNPILNSDMALVSTQVKILLT